ncbi:MAG: hypothetical protein Q4B43_07110 [Bacteroidota bacterium]|nr:hypothetical protein [Bacteroidota bacterium]
MVKKGLFLGVLLILVSCKVYDQVNCTDDEKTDEIDISLWYIEKIIKSNLELASRMNEAYIEFKENGEVVYYYEQGGKIKKTPKKYERGLYFVKKGKIYLNSFFTHPQGGGWVKYVLSRKKNDTLYFRNLESCEEQYMYIPINNMKDKL